MANLTACATLKEWIARDAIPFEIDSSKSFSAAVDELVASLGGSISLLGLGEPMHGGEEFLLLRNSLFKRLVEAHGFTAIAVESSFPRARTINQFITEQGPAEFEDIQDTGFSHEFGKLAANRELVEWMRWYNADLSRRTQLHFYGFDSPTEFTHTDSPRTLLYFALDYFERVDAESAHERRDRMDALLGSDSEWENPAANWDPAKSIGLSSAAAALRIETENFLVELQRRRPELVAKSGRIQFAEAMHYATSARSLLNYHAAVARSSPNRLAEILGIRDAMMADNLAFIMAQEQNRGQVLVHAHNSHLKRGAAEWQLGSQLLRWWPAGAHLSAMLDEHYVVIGAAIGTSDANGIGPPEADTLEAYLAADAASGLFISARTARHLSAGTKIEPRSGSNKNPSYFPLTSESLTDFDGFAFLDSATYTRGGPVLP